MQAPRLEDLLQDYSLRRAMLEAEGVVFLREINEEQAEVITHSLLLMGLQRQGNPNNAITMYINSGGGSAGAGMAIMEMMHRVRHELGVKINTVVLGYAYSMAAVVLQAGDRRSMGSLSTLMVHSSSWMLAGEDARIFRDYEKLSRHLQETISEIFASRTGRETKAWWRRFIYSGRDRFLTAQEALDLGLVDDVLEYPDDPVLHDHRHRV